MSKERLTMLKLRELLRLKFDCKLSNRKIARALNISASTVSYYHRAAIESNLSWPLSSEFDDNVLIQKLEPYCKQLKIEPRKRVADYQLIHQELKQKGVTLELLWEEYQHIDTTTAYSYSEYCRQYRIWKKQLKPSLRQNYKAGEKTFVDYAGPKIPIRNPETGVIKEAYVFVGVIAASNFTYAEATLSRSIPDWIGSHIRMFEYFGGVTELVIPDNEKAGTTRACNYDPDLNPHYAALASHYNTIFLPTRPVKPKDKAKVETAVQIVERWIMAKLRKQIFFSLEELNKAIAQLLIQLNQRPFKKLPGTRLSQFEKIDKPALKLLPKTRYELITIKKISVRLDYHIDVDGHYYSVPHALINQVVDYRTTANTLEIFYQGRRIASHPISSLQGKSTTLSEHMPSNHRYHTQWSPQLFMDWAEKIGVNMVAVTQVIIKTQPHPECCYRIHSGFRNLSKRYGNCRLEIACRYALQYAQPGFKSIQSILKNSLDKTLPECAANESVNKKTIYHQHIRGAQYYQIIK